MIIFSKLSIYSFLRLTHSSSSSLSAHIQSNQLYSLNCSLSLIYSEWRSKLLAESLAIMVWVILSVEKKYKNYWKYNLMIIKRLFIHSSSDLIENGGLKIIFQALLVENLRLKFIILLKAFSCVWELIILDAAYFLL